MVRAVDYLEVYRSTARRKRIPDLPLRVQCSGSGPNAYEDRATCQQIVDCLDLEGQMTVLEIADPATVLWVADLSTRFNSCLAPLAIDFVDGHFERS